MPVVTVAVAGAGNGRAAVASVTHDDLVAAREGDVLELTRGQETELPQALKWQVARADEDYDAALVEARRITVDTTRIASESFPMAIPPEEAERRCRRALVEAWVAMLMPLVAVLLAEELPTCKESGVELSFPEGFPNRRSRNVGNYFGMFCFMVIFDFSQSSKEC